MVSTGANIMRCTLCSLLVGRMILSLNNQKKEGGLPSELKASTGIQILTAKNCHVHVSFSF